MPQYNSCLPSKNGSADNRLVIIQRWADFLPWVEQWTGFLMMQDDPTCPFYEPEWLCAAWDYPGTPMRLSLIVSGETLRAAMAFCPRWETGASVLTPVRSIHCMPHLPMLYPTVSFLLSAPDVPASVLEWALDQTLRQIHWDVGLVGFLCKQTQWFENSLQQVIHHRGWVGREVPCSNEAVIDFTEGTEAYWATRSSDMKRKIRKGERTLCQCGEIRLMDLSEESYEWPQCWDIIRTIYDRSWQKNAGLSPFDLPWRTINLNHLQFYYQSNRLRVYTLFLDDTPIAFDIWLVGGKALYGLARGMDSKFRSGSTGDVLAQWGIDHAFQQGYRRKYLGPVSEQSHFEYKKRWMTEVIAYHKLQFFRTGSWYGILDRMYQRSSLFRWIWNRLQITTLSHKIFHFLQCLKNRICAQRRDRD